MTVSCEKYGVINLVLNNMIESAFLLLVIGFRSAYSVAPIAIPSILDIRQGNFAAYEINLIIASGCCIV